MLEYYKKYKKNKADKDKDVADKGKQPATEAALPATAAGPSSQPAAPVRVATRPAEAPLLDDEDESFFARLTSGQVSLEELDADDAAGSRPPLPPRVKTPDLTWDSDADSFMAAKKTSNRDAAPTAAKGPSAAEKLGRRISVLVRRPAKKDVKPTTLAVPEPEAQKEQDDLSRVLDDLNLSARNNRAFSVSAESTELLRRFTLVLKDLVNGVPTAADDLRGLLEDRDGKIAKSFDSLPKSLKKLVTQLPEKMGGSLAPELMAAAAASQGVAHEDNSKGGLKGTAKALLVPKTVQELVTKPSAIVGMLKAIVNALKLRWPAFVGANVIWSIALSLLLYVLWYCYKRGREVRLEKEEKDRVAGDTSSQIDANDDVPISPVSVSVTDGDAAGRRPEGGLNRELADPVTLPPPPIGANR